jgi:DNA-directed RNA polymerase subunit M/transcription elongation factor TFIIS
MDLTGIQLTPTLHFDELSRLIKYEVNYVKNDGEKINDTIVSILHYNYEPKHWKIYKPNLMGRMVVCIQFEGKYYLLVQTPRTLDRIFMFLKSEVLKASVGKSKIKNWSIRYPGENEKLEDWLQPGSATMYSHNDFICMLHWYMNNLWLFDANGLAPKNQSLRSSVAKLDHDLNQWKKKIGKVNDQYLNSIRFIVDDEPIVKKNDYTCPKCKNPKVTIWEQYIQGEGHKISSICENCGTHKVKTINNYLALEVTYENVRQYYNWRNQKKCVVFMNKNTKSKSHWTHTRAIHGLKYHQAFYEYYILKTMTKADYIKVARENVVRLPSSYHNSCSKNKLKLLYEISLNNDFQVLKSAIEQWNNKIKLVNAEYHKTYQFDDVKIQLTRKCKDNDKDYNDDGMFYYNYRTLVSYPRANNELHNPDHGDIAYLPKNYVFSCIKEQLKELCDQDRLIWGEGISKVNAEYKKRSEYIDEWNIHIFKGFDINYRELKPVFTKYYEAEIFNPSIKDGQSVGVLPKNYVYSCSQEQLKELYQTREELNGIMNLKNWQEKISQVNHEYASSDKLIVANIPTKYQYSSTSERLYDRYFEFSEVSFNEIDF